MPKPQVVGEKLICGAVPVPVSATVCGEPEALSVTEIDALRLPLADGVKVTWSVQLPDPAATVEQLFVCEKSPEFVPVIVMLLIVSGALPGFVTVIDSAVLLVLTT